MYTPTTLRAPRGHMTRPRAYAIGHKVNSILSKPSLSSRETWLLLQARTLCILRYTRGDHGEPKDQGQACAEAKEGEGRRDSCYRPRTSGPSPDIRTSPDIRPQPGHPDQPGHPARPPEIRRPSQKTPEAEPSQPGHPARREPPDIRPSSRKSGAPSQKLDPASPDIRRLGKARTSGPTP